MSYGDFLKAMARKHRSLPLLISDSKYIKSDSFLVKNQTKFRLILRNNQTKNKKWTDKDMVIREWVQDEIECHQ